MVNSVFRRANFEGETVEKSERGSVGAVRVAEVLRGLLPVEVGLPLVVRIRLNPRKIANAKLFGRQLRLRLRRAKIPEFGGQDVVSAASAETANKVQAGARLNCPRR